MRIRHRLIGLLLWCTPAIVSAQARDPEHTPGAVEVVNDIASAPGLTAAQRAAASAAATRLIAALRRNPAIGSPVGYTVRLRVAAFPRLPGDAPDMPYHTILFGTSHYFTWADDGHGGRTIAPGPIALDFAIGINTAGYAADMENDAEEPDHGPRIMGADEAGGDVYPLTESFRGHPVYGGACTYLSHRPAPPIVPVTRERYLTVQLLTQRATLSRHDAQHAGSAGSMNAQLEEFLRDRPQREANNRKVLDALKQAGADATQIRQASDQLHDAEKQQEAALRANTTNGTDQKMQDAIQQGHAGESDRIAKTQADLDALSPAERASPIALTSHGRSDFSIADPGDPGALPLMQPNASFYDAAIGASAPQLIWICAYHLQGLEDRSYERLATGSDEWREEKAYTERRIRDAVRFRDQMDWSALEALLKP